jgi:curved DNA-binding protein CbpA
MATKFDYYDILQVPKQSTNDDIKKSFRRLAKLWHPDKNKTKDAENKFKDLSKAYKVLSDPIRRELYDIEIGCNKNHKNYDSDYIDLIDDSKFLSKIWEFVSSKFVFHQVLMMMMAQALLTMQMMKLPIRTVTATNIS